MGVPRGILLLPVARTQKHLRLLANRIDFVGVEEDVFEQTPGVLAFGMNSSDHSIHNYLMFLLGLQSAVIRSDPLF